MSKIEFVLLCILHLLVWEFSKLLNTHLWSLKCYKVLFSRVTSTLVQHGTSLEVWVVASSCVLDEEINNAIRQVRYKCIVYVYVVTLYKWQTLDALKSIYHGHLQLLHLQRTSLLSRVKWLQLFLFTQVMKSSLTYFAGVLWNHYGLVTTIHTLQVEILTKSNKTFVFLYFQLR